MFIRSQVCTSRPAEPDVRIFNEARTRQSASPAVGDDLGGNGLAECLGTRGWVYRAYQPCLLPERLCPP